MHDKYSLVAYDWLGRYVDKDFAKEGSEIAVHLRGKMISAEVLWI